MGSPDHDAELKLFFDGDNPELTGTEFKHPDLQHSQKCVRANDLRAGADGAFKFTRGVEALCCLALGAKATHNDQKRAHLVGERGTLAACLEEAVRIAGKSKNHWLRNVFGEVNGRPLASKMILRLNAGRKRAGPVSVSFSSRLTSNNIHIYVNNGYLLTDPSQIQALAERLQKRSSKHLTNPQTRRDGRPTKPRPWHGALPWKSTFATFTVGVFAIALRLNFRGEMEVFCQGRGDAEWWPNTGKTNETNDRPVIVDIPGGGVEKCDKTLLDALAREVREETNGCRVNVIVDEPIGPLALINGDKRDLAFGYLAEIVGDAQPTHEARFHDWIPWSELEAEKRFRLPGNGKTSRLGQMIEFAIARFGDIVAKRSKASYFVEGAAQRRPASSSRTVSSKKRQLKHGRNGVLATAVVVDSRNLSDQATAMTKKKPR